MAVNNTALLLLREISTEPVKEADPDPEIEKDKDLEDPMTLLPTHLKVNKLFNLDRKVKIRIPELTSDLLSFRDFLIHQVFFYFIQS